MESCRKAGLKEIPAIIIEADDLKATELAMVENLQREDLNPVEEAEGYRVLMSTYGLKQEEVAQGLEGHALQLQCCRLLSLESSVWRCEMAICRGHARTLLTLPENAETLSRAYHIPTVIS